MPLLMRISRKENTACAVFEVEGTKFYVPQISGYHIRPQWGGLGGTSMFDMFKEAEAKLINSNTVLLKHPEWDADLILRANGSDRVVESFGSGTFFSTFRGMKIKVFKSVRRGEWETDTSQETW